MSTLVDRVRKRVWQRVNRPEQSVAHRFDHVQRVMLNAANISSVMTAVDNELLELSVLLHDVNQPAGKKAEHVELSVAAAGAILRGEGCSGERARQVQEVIFQHSTEHIEIIRPSSTEAKILFDADKLDGLTPVGIARVFALFGQMGRPPFDAIPWYREKIAVSVKNLQTEEGRRLFELRQGYVEEFLQHMETQSVSSFWSYSSATVGF